MRKLSPDTDKILLSKKRVLMIAYHFPPIQGSSGVHRTVQFARHLPSFGWVPIIVAPHPRAYPDVGDDAWAKLPAECIVKRAFALDSAFHLAVKGRYFDVSAMPDRWISWWPGAVFECLKLIHKYKPHVIWSTFPIATAHLIGLTVSRLTGLPWVADFRDPMVQEGQPSSRLNRSIYGWLEKKVVGHSSCCTLVTRSALDDYSQRYPDKGRDSWTLIENGYDESLFEPYHGLFGGSNERSVDQPIKMLHSGILYSSGRNPLPFLEAVKTLIEKNGFNIKVTFRGCGNEKEVGEQIDRLNLTHIVKLLPSISYDDAIREMVESDVLLLFQGAVFNKQVPAKVYEYIRAGRPIFALTDMAGETASVLRNVKASYLADIDSRESIIDSMSVMLDRFNNNFDADRSVQDVEVYSRYEKTKELSRLLNYVSV